MPDDKFRLSANEIEHFLENGEGLDSLFDALEKALNILKDEGGKNFIFGPIIIDNDLEIEEEEDDEDEESDESDDETTTETKE